MYDDTSDLKMDFLEDLEGIYIYKTQLYERYLAASGEERLRLKIRIAEALVNEIHLCFNRYNDTGVASGLNRLKEFLAGKTETVTFIEDSGTFRNIGVGH